MKFSVGSREGRRCRSLFGSVTGLEPEISVDWVTNRDQGGIGGLRKQCDASGNSSNLGIHVCAE